MPEQKQKLKIKGKRGNIQVIQTQKKYTDKDGVIHVDHNVQIIKTTVPLNPFQPKTTETYYMNQETNTLE